MFAPNRFLPNAHDPLQPPDLRWRRCLYLHRHRRQPSSDRDDDATRACCRYLWDRRASRDRDRLTVLNPAVAAAHSLFRRAAPLVRAEVEARLLARQSDDEIASQCALSAAAVGAYHDLFFHVRDSLDAKMYVINVVIGPRAHADLSENDTDIILKLLGYTLGPRMVDLALRYFRNPPVLPPRFDGLDAATLFELSLLLRVRILILTMVTPAQSFVRRKLTLVPALTRDGSAARVPEQTADLSVEACLREQMRVLSPASLPDVLPFDRTASLDVPEWLSTCLARLCG